MCNNACTHARMHARTHTPVNAYWIHGRDFSEQLMNHPVELRRVKDSPQTNKQTNKQTNRNIQMADCGAAAKSSLGSSDESHYPKTLDPPAASSANSYLLRSGLLLRCSAK